MEILKLEEWKRHKYYDQKLTCTLENGYGNECASQAFYHNYRKTCLRCQPCVFSCSLLHRSACVQSAKPVGVQCSASPSLHSQHRVTPPAGNSLLWASLTPFSLSLTLDHPSVFGHHFLLPADHYYDLKSHVNLYHFFRELRIRAITSLMSQRPC